MSDATDPKAEPKPAAPPTAPTAPRLRKTRSRSRAWPRRSADPRAAKPAAHNAATQPRGGPQKDVFKTVFTVAWLAILLGFAIEALLLDRGDRLRHRHGAEAVHRRPDQQGLVVLPGVRRARLRQRDQQGAARSGRALRSALRPTRLRHRAFDAQGRRRRPRPRRHGRRPVAPDHRPGQGVQYALFGFVLGKLEKKIGVGLAAYAGVGFLAGLLFGGVILGYTLGQDPRRPPAAALVARGISEILFPVGCAAVLYVSGILGKKAA